MALNSIQLPTWSDLERDLESVAGEITSRGVRWSQLSAFVNKMDASDLTAMGLTQAQQDELLPILASYRTALNAIVTVINAQTVFDHLV